MGLEKDLRKRIRIGKYQSAFLTTLAVAGTVLTAVAAPNALSLLGKTVNARTRAKSKSALTRLHEQGLITLESRPSGQYISLTAKGRRYVDQSTVPRTYSWDGRWRLVIFDIPQGRTAYRNLLRQKLNEVGFVRLQNSVYVHPFDCEELVILLKTEFGLGKEILYVIADSIENDRGLRDRFKLKRRR